MESWLIEELRRLKREQFEEAAQQLPLPLPEPPPGWEPPRKPDEPKRGVIVIDYSV